MQSPNLYRKKVPFIPLLIERPIIFQKGSLLVRSQTKAINQGSAVSKSVQLETINNLNQQNIPDEVITKSDIYSNGVLKNQYIKTQPSEQSDDQYHCKVMEDRINILDQLTQIVKKQNKGFDLIKLIEGINEISRTLSQASKTEIELNRKSRDLEQKILEGVMIQKQLEKAQVQTAFYRSETLENSKKFNLNQQDQQKYVRELHSSKIKNDELSKKILCLEKRIEMTLERNLNLHQDTLRNTLNDLIKETEEQKRQLIKKTKAIDHLKDLNQKIANKNIRIQKKLDSFKTKYVGKDDLEDSTTLTSDEYDYAFDPSSIPSNLEFRLQSLPSEYTYLLLDLVGLGPDNFAQQVLNLENQIQKKDLMSLVANQFISYREFSEKYNSLMSELSIMLSYSYIKDYQVHIAKGMKQLLNAEIVHIWTIDQMTGIVHTHDQNNKEMRAILNDGAFQEVINQGIIVNKIKDHDVLLYANDNGDVFGDRLLLIPLIGAQRKPCGLLEIRGISLDLSQQLDVQYFGLIISKISKVIFQKIIDTEAIQHEMKYKDMFHSQFISLCNSKKDQDFSLGVQEMVYKIFQVTQTSIMFIKDSRFIKYSADGTESSFHINTGIAGSSYKLERAQIITDVKRNFNFDESVDVTSVLPIYCAPLKNKEGKIELIIQFSLKSKLNQFKHPYGLQANIGFKVDSIDYDAHKFCEFVQTAYLLYKK